MLQRDRSVYAFLDLHVFVTLRLQLKYLQNPAALYKIIKHCLALEMKYVQQVEGTLGTPLPNIPSNRLIMPVDIIQQLGALRQKALDCADDIRKMEHDQESFALSYHECTKLNAQVQHLATQPLQSLQSQQVFEVDKKIRRCETMTCELMIVSCRITLYINEIVFLLYEGKENSRSRP